MYYRILLCQKVQSRHSSSQASIQDSAALSPKAPLQQAIESSARSGGRKTRSYFPLSRRDSAFPLLLDVTNYGSIPAIVGQAEERIGPIDVLVNNAGYGHEGALEESSIDDLQRQFAANVFGPVAMIKAVLPGMRKRRRGHIVNVTSMGGFITMPGISFYCGSKFALEGISEALGKEVAPFGIRVTSLAPGQFRTEWAGRSMDRTPRSIADYDAVMEPIRAARKAKSGKQPGDPAKAAQALLTLIAAEKTPVRLFLGDDALGLVTQKLDAMRVEIADWDGVSRSTSFGA